MSTIVMGKVWPLQGMTATQKIVYISLADNANDHGVCWPSVDTIAMRCCLTDRAVRKALDWLVERGAIQRRRGGGARSNSYTLTPEQYSPLNHVHPKEPLNDIHLCTPFTPERRSGEGGTTFTPPLNDVHPNRHRTVKEPSIGAPRARRTARPVDNADAEGGKVKGRTLEKVRRKAAAGKPKSDEKSDADPKKLTEAHLIIEGVSLEHARDWITLRNAKRLPLTPTAWNGVKEEAAKVGMTPAQAVEYCVKANWVGFKPEWFKRREDVGGKGHPSTSTQADSPSAWFLSATGIAEQGERVGVQQRANEPMPDYLVRVARASGKGPWIDHVLKEARKGNAERYRQIVDFFGDDLLPVDFIE